MERAYPADYFTGVEQKISDWLIKILFLQEVETISSGIKSSFGIMDFSTSNSIVDLRFFL